jgi:hypothetical protein
MAEAHCRTCGAPWRSTVVGSCHYCGGFGRPPEAGQAPRPGELDVEALCLSLVARCENPDRPLDALSEILAAALGPERVSTETKDGRVTRLRVSAADRRFDAAVRGAGVEATDVHAVKGIVIRTQELDLGGLLAELSMLLAPLAISDPQLHDTLAHLSR